MLFTLNKRKEKKKREEPVIVDDDSDLVVFYMDQYGNKCSTCPFRGLCGG